MNNTIKILKDDLEFCFPLEADERGNVVLLDLEVTTLVKKAERQGTNVFDL